MAHALSIGSVNVSAGDYGLLAYEPQPGGKDLVRVLVTGADSNELETLKAAIELEMVQGVRYTERKVGTKKYVTWTPNGGSTTWRSPITGGYCQWGPQAKGYEWAGLKVELQIKLEREDWFEDNSETALSLSNTHGSGTSGVTVYNHDDPNEDNHVKITGTDVDGELPAPARIVLTNNTGGARIYGNIYVGHNVYANFITLTVEGETGTGGSSVADATCSYTGYQQVALGATEANLITWALPGATLDDGAGLYFREIIRLFEAAPANTYIRMKWQKSSTVIWQSEEFLLDESMLQPFTTIRMPPQLAGLTSYAGLDLVLAGRGSGNLKVDVILHMPLESFRRVVQLAGSIANNDQLVIDEIDGFVYGVDSSSDKYALFARYGTPIMLIPGEDQRLYFLWDQRTGDHVISHTWSAKVFYRKRVRTP